MSMCFCIGCGHLIDTDDDPESCVDDSYRCEVCRELDGEFGAFDHMADENELRNQE